MPCSFAMPHYFPPPAPDRYTAIAYSVERDASGWSWDAATQADAEARALQECGNDCQVVAHHINACSALATSVHGAWGTAWGRTRAEARRNALVWCENNGDGRCSVRVDVCSTTAFTRSGARRR